MSALREMLIEDYEQCVELWRGIEGLVLSASDEKDAIAEYLIRNKGLSFVAELDGIIVGTILCGHDGRRGYIYHVAVNPDYRGRRIGHQLVEQGLERLRAQGMDKCHLFVLEDNEPGQRFWSAVGWQKRSGFYVYSKDV